MTLRSDLRTLIRQELQDTAAPSLWSDAAINTALAAAFIAYSQSFPNLYEQIFTLGGGSQTIFSPPVGTLAIRAVLINGVTAPQVPDLTTLLEPAFRNQWSQTYVQPVAPLGAAATHGQAWAVVDGAVQMRYPVFAPATVQLSLAAVHICPTDDATAVTVPDGDDELIVLYACDRLWHSARVDWAKRGALPSAALADDPGYQTRYRAALRDRTRLISRVLTANQ